MLTSETKRKIDNLRDTLVGKIPVPTQQIEQITLGLIYKFMSDIDTQNKGLGGKSFFGNGYSKYSWEHIMDRSLAGHERVVLYAEGLEKMSQNKNIPQLFRDIFRGAFLPYKDPVLLDHFLKGINELNYDHSEELGNAFEYLLSVMGSQGDAGQFRTPRHIIDFIVAAVDPQKTDRILDPACGTAGFLISAYKHILVQNTDPNSGRPGSLLSPAEKKKLAKNFVGYDISYDMVRLSLVNMYLHHFPEPSIYEYDTLASLDRWENDFECILANPPFMTPRGGIKPHNRFSIQANRSEVLFVDYIAEHLTPNGKAGVIVPEGIIFKGDNAYKALRKMLVDSGLLYAVVSLPSGVFNPYSGVKTSILLMDRVLAKKAKGILFIKADNDGYDLGAQRRPIDKDDLPQALEVIQKYKNYLAGSDSEPFENNSHSKFAIVPKEKIAAGGEYGLTADRYIEEVLREYKWPVVELREVCEINPKKSEIRKLNPETEVSFIPMSDLGQNKVYSEALQARKLSEVVGSYTYFTEKDILLARVTPCFENGKAGITRNLKNKIGFGSSEFIVLRASDGILPELVYYFVTSRDFRKLGISQMTGTGGLQRVPGDFVKKYQIPLPPLDVQKEIVAELDGYQKVIDGAKQILDNYKPTIKIDPSWKEALLGEVAEFKRGPFGGSLKKEIFIKTGYKVYEQKNAIKDNFEIGDYYIDENKFNEMKDFSVQPGDLIISCSGTMGKVAIAPKTIKLGIINQALLKLTPIANKINVKFLKYILESSSIQQRYFRDTSGAAIKNVASVKHLKTIKIPLPSVEIQEKVVMAVEREQKTIEANKELAELFEQKVKDTISEVWGE